MKKIIIHYLMVGFILNFIWEISQAGLYEPHFQGSIDFILVHLRASLGDIVILLVIYMIVSLAYEYEKWIFKSRFNSYIFVAFLGLILAVAIEKYALLTGRWVYNGSMPIIPYIDVGLTPVLQMVIIAPFSFFLAEKAIIKNE